MKKIIGILCLLYPVLAWLTLVICDVEYFWYFFDGFKTIDLIHSLVSFFIFVLGVHLVSSNLSSKSYILFFVSMPFLFYLMIRWEFTTNHYIAKKKVNTDIHLVLVSYDVGAFSAQSFANLEVVERVMLVFIQRRSMKTYDNISSAKISLLNEQVKLDLKSYNGDLASESFSLAELIAN